MALTLEQARRLNMFSRCHVAKELGVAEATIYRWEKGKSAPDIAQFQKLCKLYNLKMDDIFVCKSN